MDNTNIPNEISMNDLSTPCFIFDESEFANGIKGFRNALMAKFCDVAIGYSVKTNSLPYAMQKAKDLGCMAEVVSHDEYQMARLCGYTPNEIIYNGPMKSKDTFLEAVVNGAIVNIETKREVDWLKELPSNQNCNVGIRLNINISHVSIEDADGEDDNSRFGFSDESGEFSEAINTIQSIKNVRLSGLHIHRTAHSRSPRFYRRSIEYAVHVIRKYHLDLDYIDLGGGFYGIFPDTPTFGDYADAFKTSLAIHGFDHLKVIIEPGNALTAAPFSFLTEVIDTKRIDAQTYFATTDGSRNDIDPFFRKSDYIKEIFRKNHSESIEPLQIVAGCTCLEYDRLFTLVDQPRLTIGDRILYHNVGAYTMTLSPQFIRLWPRVYARSMEGSYTEVRRAGRAFDILQSNKSSIYSKSL